MRQNHRNWTSRTKLEAGQDHLSYLGKPWYHLCKVRPGVPWVKSGSAYIWPRSKCSSQGVYQGPLAAQVRAQSAHLGFLTSSRMFCHAPWVWFGVPVTEVRVGCARFSWPLGCLWFSKGLQENSIKIIRLADCLKSGDMTVILSWVTFPLMLTYL